MLGSEMTMSDMPDQPDQPETGTPEETIAYAGPGAEAGPMPDTEDDLEIMSWRPRPLSDQDRRNLSVMVLDQETYPDRRIMVGRDEIINYRLMIRTAMESMVALDRAVAASFGSFGYAQEIEAAPSLMYQVSVRCSDSPQKALEHAC